MIRFASYVLALIVVLAAPQFEAVAAGTTHTWTGLDTKSPHDWKKSKNWNTSSVPQAGDSVIIKGHAVQNAPDIHLASISLEEDAVITSGGPLFVDRLELRCARLRVSATVNQAALVIGGELRPLDDPVELFSPGELTVRAPTILDSGCTDSTLIEPGILKIFTGARIQNTGVIKGGNGVIQGMTCCTAPQVIENRTTGRIDATDGLTLRDLRIVHRGKVAGGRLTLQRGDHIFRNGSRFQGVTVEADGARITVPQLAGGNGSQVTLGERTLFKLREGAELLGAAEWDGPGTLRFEEGDISGDQVIGVKTTFETVGPRSKWIRPSDATDPGRVTVKGKAILWDGPLTLSGRLVIEGTLTVPKDERPLVQGSNCCTSPIPMLDLRGATRVERGGRLKLQDMRLFSHASIGGEGELLIEGGDHVIDDSTVFDLPVELKGGAILRPLGEISVLKTVEQTDGATVAGTLRVPPFITGNGRWTWRDGNLSDRLRFGANLAVTVTGPALKQYTGSETVRFEGPLRIEGPGDLRIDAGATVEATGAVTLAGARVTASGCCSGPDAVFAAKNVTLDRAAGKSSLNTLQARFTGTVDLNGATLEIDTLDPAFEGSAALRLEGGVLRTGGSPAFGPSAKLIGPGTVYGRVVMEGTVTFATRGLLFIQGQYVQRAGARLEIRFAAGGRDWLDVSGAATIGGEIHFAGTIGSITRDYTILAAGSLTGRFTSVTGLPAPKKLVYGPNEVVVVPR